MITAQKVLLLLLMVITASALSAATENLPVRRFALYIGANEGGKNRAILQYAVKDAQTLSEVMSEVGGVAKSDQILLSNPRSNEIISSLDSLNRPMIEAKNQSKRVEILFYYSGHSDEDGLLLADSTLTYKDIRDSLQKLPADVKIAILDSCSSGAFARTKGGTQKPPFLVDEASKMTGHAYLTSSSENEASQESDKIQGSFFTHYLVSGLRGGADTTSDGKITLNELYQHAFHHTLEKTESTKAGPQHPSYDIQLTGTGDLVLTDIQNFSSRLRIEDTLSGRVFVRSEGGILAAEVEKTAGTQLLLALPEGRYSVLISQKTISQGASVSLKAQTETLIRASDLSSSPLAINRIRGDQPSNTDETAGETQPPKTFDLQLIPGISFGLTSISPQNYSLCLSPLTAMSINFEGLQASGVISHTDGYLKGLQFAGVGTSVSDRMNGIQGSGVYAYAGGEFKGIQAAGVSCYAGSGDFFQTSGVFNWTYGAMKGFQASGVVNIVGQLNGFQAAGVVNIADEVKGFQLSGTLNTANKFKGLQIGVVNIAGIGKGMQIGVINISKDKEIVPIGLINIGPSSYLHASVMIDSAGDPSANVQWGNGPLYIYYSMTTDAKFGQVYERLCGMGIQWDRKEWYLDTDLGVGRRGLDLQTQEGWDNLNDMNQLYIGVRAQGGVKIGIAALFAGWKGTWASDKFSDPLSTAADSYDLSFRLWQTDFTIKNRFFIGVRL